jgi:hypothetical protein
MPDASQDLDALARGLLRDPVPDDDQPGERWAYPFRAMLAISLFVIYHVVAVLAFNLPNVPATRSLQFFLNARLGMTDYIWTTGNYQDWGLFAPDPARSNLFLRVLVEDETGSVVDMGHDIYGRRTYPYLVYDRMGKINRRVATGDEYREPYAAWVCREWARSHGGEPPREVRLVNMGTRLPSPDVAYASMGFDPRALPLVTRVPDRYRCADIPQGQLPPFLRARFGLSGHAGIPFRDVTLRTWWTARGPDGRAGGPGARESGTAAPREGRQIE